MSLDALLFALGGYPRKKASKKKATKSYSNWFEKLQLDELKSLCRASLLPVSGTKAALCERLCEGELSSSYAYEYAPEKFSRARMEYEMGSLDFENYGNVGVAAPRPAQQGSKRSSGYSNDDLKTMCSEKGLSKSGKRYDLVLRLLQHQSGTGGAPKRAAGTVDEQGNFQPKKRAKSMKIPNVEKLEERILKKFFPSDEKTAKWGNNKYKYYPPECIKWACDLITKEIFEKELFQRGEEKVAWDLINVILYRITEGNAERRREWAAEQRAKASGGMWMMIGGTDFYLGRCSSELAYDFLPLIVKAMKATNSKSALNELAGDTLWEFQTKKLSECSEYDRVSYPIKGTFDTKKESFKAILNEYIPRKESTMTTSERIQWETKEYFPQKESTA